VDQPQAAEVARAKTEQPKIRDENTSAITYQNVGYVATAIDEDAKLPSGFP
jgi:hypothetical protein